MNLHHKDNHAVVVGHIENYPEAIYFVAHGDRPEIYSAQVSAYDAIPGWARKQINKAELGQLRANKCSAQERC